MNIVEIIAIFSTIFILWLSNTSELTYYECFRAYKSSSSSIELLIFKQLIETINVHPLDIEIYEKGSKIYAKLCEIGYPSGEFDILIASTALVKKYKLAICADYKPKLPLTFIGIRL